MENMVITEGKGDMYTITFDTKKKLVKYHPTTLDELCEVRKHKDITIINYTEGEEMVRKFWQQLGY